MKISKRQREYLDAIAVFVEANGYNPTQADLARQLGVHRNTVHAVPCAPLASVD